MLPTLVIGLREGLEASLIVGIIAAFLRQQERRDLLRWMVVGVAAATALCIGVGVALEVLSRDLPQRQQEGLETVIGALAVAMVSYMVVWMRRHSRELKGSLEGAAAVALAAGGSRAGRAMVLMAFLAVLREGFETVVFLLAAFNETGNGASPMIGAVVGIAIAVLLGWAIYRGGVRLNLSKFFRATGLVLVFVAAGLVVTAFHTAHEAGWLDAGQGTTFSLAWLVRPGSVQSSLLTGMLGMQPHPVVIEVVGWLGYAIPMALYVAWPPGRGLSPRRASQLAGLGAGLAGIATVALTVAIPAAPTSRPVTAAANLRAQVLSASGDSASVRITAGSADEPATLAVHRTASNVVDGIAVVGYSGSSVAPQPAAGPRMLSLTTIAGLNGGRLPIGIGTHGGHRLPVTYRATRTVSLQVAPSTLRVVTASWTKRVSASVMSPVGAIPIAEPLSETHSALPAAAVAAALSAARHDGDQSADRTNQRELAVGFAVVAVVLIGVASVSGAGARRRRTTSVSADRPTLPSIKENRVLARQ